MARRILLGLTLLATSLPLLAMGDAAAVPCITYSTVPGYFLQDDPAVDPKTFDYVCTPRSVSAISLITMYAGEGRLWADRPSLRYRRDPGCRAEEAPLAQVRT